MYGKLLIVVLFCFSMVKLEKAEIAVKKIKSNNFDSLSDDLKQGLNPDAKFNGTPVIFFAIVPKCNVEIVELLLLYGANPNLIQEGTNQTPLLEALAFGNVECVKSLIDAGGDIALSDINKLGAAYRSVESGNIEVLKLVRYLGANINLKGKDGSTPLMYAAGAGQEDMVIYLIENGALVCDKNLKGVSVLEFAKYSNNLRIIDLVESRSKDC